MDGWLSAALDYVPRWVAFQTRLLEQPGCAVAVAHKGEVVLDQAFGQADLASGTPLTARHRFRVASHSKSFTAAGILKLREAGRLRLDDRVGEHVGGLHPDVGRATIGQLLSHSAGIVRDGTDSGFWSGRAPFPDTARLRVDLAAPPVIEANTRFKYSNHGYGLAGLVIEAVTGEPYTAWIKREIVEPAGLAETEPDVAPARDPPLAQGHSGKLPLGRRVVFPGAAAADALAPATGFVSTAADLARFFSQLSPRSARGLISVESRREMTRRQWRDPHAAVALWYGLGIVSGEIDGWEWFGHTGGFQGYLTRTSVVPDRDLAVSVLTNASDGMAYPWADGILHVLARFASGGAPEGDLADWTGRWWSVWGATDLVPVGKRVLLAVPAWLKPLQSVSECEVADRDSGHIALAGGFGSQGEPIRRERGADGQVQAVRVAGSWLVTEAALAEEMRGRYEGAADPGADSLGLEPTPPPGPIPQGEG
jgi:CubicO group peptidase (beta-lactamase class C family)